MKDRSKKLFIICLGVILLSCGGQAPLSASVDSLEDNSKRNQSNVEPIEVLTEKKEIVEPLLELPLNVTKQEDSYYETLPVVERTSSGWKSPKWIDNSDEHLSLLEQSMCLYQSRQIFTGVPSSEKNQSSTAIMLDTMDLSAPGGSLKIETWHNGAERCFYKGDVIYKTDNVIVAAHGESSRVVEKGTHDEIDGPNCHLKIDKLNDVYTITEDWPRDCSSRWCGEMGTVIGRSWRARSNREHCKKIKTDNNNKMGSIASGPPPAWSIPVKGETDKFEKKYIGNWSHRHKVSVFSGVDGEEWVDQMVENSMRISTDEQGEYRGDLQNTTTNLHGCYFEGKAYLNEDDDLLLISQDDSSFYRSYDREEINGPACRLLFKFKKKHLVTVDIWPPWCGGGVPYCGARGSLTGTVFSKRTTPLSK